MKKVVLEVDDFNKIVDFVTARTIPFPDCVKATEILNIFRSAKIAETQENPNINDRSKI